MPVAIQGVQLVRLPPCSYTTAAFPTKEAVGLLPGAFQDFAAVSALDAQRQKSAVCEHQNTGTAQGHRPPRHGTTVPAKVAKPSYEVRHVNGHFLPPLKRISSSEIASQ